MNRIIKLFNENRIKGEIFISIFLTLLYLFGDIKVYQQKGSLLKYILIFLIYIIFLRIYNYITSKSIYGKSIDKIDKLFNQKNMFILIIIFWIPHLIIKYPIAFWSDEYSQIIEGLTYSEFTTHWPLFVTTILTGFYKFGELIGSHNVGMLMYAIIQAIIGALISSYTILSFKKMKVNNIFLIVFTLFFISNPLIFGNIGTSLKDSSYSFFVLLFCILLVKYVYDRKSFWINKSNIILFFIASIFMCLYRNNGIYVLVPTIVIIVIYEFKNKNIKNIIILLIVILTSILNMKVFEIAYNAEKGSIGETLSLPLQQTARFVKYNEELVTNEEKEIISRVLPYNDLKNKYDETISDPVKNEFNSNASSEDIFNYLKVWFKQFFKAPLTYCDATLSQNFYMLYPGYNVYHYNVECNGGKVDYDKQEEGLVQTPLWIKNTLQPLYASGLEVLHTTPIVQLLNNISSYVILFIFSLAIIFNRKEYDKLIVYFPIFLSFLVVIASPSILSHPRYVYPIVYCFPIVVGTLIIKNRKDNIVK